jgi:hypothetical protein
MDVALEYRGKYQHILKSLITKAPITSSVLYISVMPAQILVKSFVSAVTFEATGAEHS